MILVMVLFMLSGKAQGYIDVVVIDPGHGGRDPGAVGSIYKEKDLVLDMALKVGHYIEENFEDVKVIYTRKTDVFIPLWKRAEIANKNNADLFISIHVNAVGSSRPYGTETFVMGPHKTQANLEVAKQENASVLLEDNYEHQYEGFDPNSPEAHIIFSLYQSTYLEQSLKLAEKVQYQFRERVSRHDRGVKQAGLLVLWQAAMPAVLVEAGFISHPAEEKFLGSEEGKTYLASAIYRAFKEYKMEMEDGLDEQPDQSVTAENEEETAENEEEEKTEQAEVYFAVQFATSSHLKEVSDFENEKLTNVKQYFHNGLYKYYVGTERSLNDAVLLQHKLNEAGYADAFVIAFKDGKRISVSEASEFIAQ